MNLTTIAYNFIKDYIESFRRDYLTKEFGYSSYNPPNTMFKISNDLPEVMITLSLPTIRVYMRCLTLLKRNADPLVGCTILMKHEDYSSVVKRSAFFKSKKELIEAGLLVKTPKPNLMIVNIQYANKLYNPKLDI